MNADFIIIIVCLVLVWLTFYRMSRSLPTRRGTTWYVRANGGLSTDPATWSRDPIRQAYGDYYNGVVPSSGDDIVVKEESGDLTIVSSRPFQALTLDASMGVSALDFQSGSTLIRGWSSGSEGSLVVKSSEVGFDDRDIPDVDDSESEHK